MNWNKLQILPLSVFSGDKIVSSAIIRCTEWGKEIGRQFETAMAPAVRGKNKILWLPREEVTSNTDMVANPVTDTKVCCILSCSLVMCWLLLHGTVALGGIEVFRVLVWNKEQNLWFCPLQQNCCPEEDKALFAFLMYYAINCTETPSNKVKQVGMAHNRLLEHASSSGSLWAVKKPLWQFC